MFICIYHGNPAPSTVNSCHKKRGEVEKERVKEEVGEQKLPLAASCKVFSGLNSLAPCVFSAKRIV